MIVEFMNGFFAEEDQMQVTLRQRKPVKDENGFVKNEDGTVKETVKLIGYFSNMKDALERFIKHMRIEGKEETVLSLEEYLNELKQADIEVETFLKELFEEKNGKKDNE